ncbi:hypothetical protein GCK72_018438 [Caenorhabditis remanei]|uniref:C-type lectin domain-containing protein n=1 Tax=Caenorhabditis remanei TaxID=31234 RepID=A0A6A5GB23_CAERE|nr:hypothetical protein GCK72_018438 [Caenorhabditis remanei]KAF1751884.1 hypothetical protein GCK72_018438 [Caenorhabditis remanei]
MGGKLLIFVLLGCSFLLVVDSRRPPIQHDNVEEDCEEDDGGGYDSDGRPNRVGATRPPATRQRAEDDWDGVEEPTDDDYLRYENTNQEGICLLERGKCPQGDWRMFKRHNETVCLKIYGAPYTIDISTAAKVCREQANARVMTVDSDEERRWIYSTPLGGNGSYTMMFIAGNRNRECKANPLVPKCADKNTAFTQSDGTSDHKYIYSRWAPTILNRFLYGGYDDCLAFLTYPHAISIDHAVQDFTCDKHTLNTVLCGVTVM